jgi:endonuclease YncB( thermonuclease family)
MAWLRFPLGGLLFGGALCCGGSETLQEIRRVVDGDTVDITSGLSGEAEERVRLIGVNAPELFSPGKPPACGAVAAREALVQYLGDRGGEVSLELDPLTGTQDRYGRTLAYVWFEGRLINRRLIQDGWAKADRYHTYRHRSDFEDQEAAAIRAAIGVWKCPYDSP